MVLSLVVICLAFIRRLLDVKCQYTIDQLIDFHRATGGGIPDGIDILTIGPYCKVHFPPKYLLMEIISLYDDITKGLYHYRTQDYNKIRFYIELHLYDGNYMKLVEKAKGVKLYSIVFDCFNNILIRSISDLAFQGKVSKVGKLIRRYKDRHHLYGNELDYHALRGFVAGDHKRIVSRILHKYERYYASYLNRMIKIAILTSVKYSRLGIFRFILKKYPYKCFDLYTHILPRIRGKKTGEIFSTVVNFYGKKQPDDMYYFSPDLFEYFYRNKPFYLNQEYFWFEIGLLLKFSRFSFAFYLLERFYPYLGTPEEIFIKINSVIELLNYSDQAKILRFYFKIFPSNTPYWVNPEKPVV